MTNSDKGGIMLFFFCILFFCLGILFTINLTYDKRYKDGQIDALNGIVKYKKEIQKDSSVIWVEIKQK